MVVRVEIKPGYGWGWFERDVAVDVPQTFYAELEPNKSGWSGTVLDGSYSGWRVEMTPRHLPFDGDVNLALENKHEGRSISGYANLAHEAFK
jgi:hypothetical protein